MGGHLSLQVNVSLCGLPLLYLPELYRSSSQIQSDHTTTCCPVSEAIYIAISAFPLESTSLLGGHPFPTQSREQSKLFSLVASSGFHC